MMKLKSFSFLVTGGAGFIGTNLVQRLLSEGGRVFVLDNLSSGFASNIPSGANFIEGDVADPNIWKTLPSVDYIYHLGAMVSVVESMEDPIKCEQVNVHSILHLLDYARRCKVRKIIFASSAAIYGDLSEIQVESQYPDPKSPYGLSKLSGEYFLRMGWKTEGIPYVALRMFNVFGPYQSVGSAYASVIPIFVNKVLNKQVIQIYGDGSQTRDFIYVQQVVDYYIQALKVGLVGVYNAGNNSNCSINMLAHKVAAAVGDLDPIIEYLDPRPGDIKTSLADISRLKEDFVVQDLDFDCALKETVNYYRSIK